MSLNVFNVLKIFRIQLHVYDNDFKEFYIKNFEIE